MKTLPIIIPNAQVYKVGGYVRDKLLGIPPHDCDYVVVGSTPQQMLKLGFIQVGKKFPVFLHPKTKEEFALARHDIKIGSGHKGFEFKIDPDVTIYEDLIRRDITINAIAEDINGNIIDPFGGVDDLKHKVIRHVSPAFAEDPLRVLRVARFKARFDFTIAPETIKLMQQIVMHGELATLSSERIHGELHKALMSDNCYIFFEVLDQVGALDITFHIFKTILSDHNSNQFIQYVLKNLNITIRQKLKLQNSLYAQGINDNTYDISPICVNLICLTFFCNLAYKKFNLDSIELSQLRKNLGLNNNNLRLATIVINHYPTIANIMSEPVTSIRKMIQRLATRKLKLHFFLLSEIIGSIEKQHSVIIKNITITNQLIQEFNTIDRKHILKDILEKDRADFIKKFELDFICQTLAKLI